MTTTNVTWVDVCSLDDLVPLRGAAARLEDVEIALFRLEDDEVLAIGAVDPFFGAPVLPRGIVGHLKGRDVVASPLHKQHFDLRTGACTEDTGKSVPTFATRLVGRRLQVQLT